MYYFLHPLLFTDQDAKHLENTVLVEYIQGSKM